MSDLANARLSPHFSLAELTHSETAQRLGIDNTPNDATLLNLSRLANTVLEPARAVCRVPLAVNDGYRCPAVNAAVGGVHDSQHELGLAADVVPEGLDLEDAFDLIRKSPDVPFDQCILESGCIHLSCKGDDGMPPRRDALIRHGLKGNWSYTRASDA